MDTKSDFTESPTPPSPISLVPDLPSTSVDSDALPALPASSEELGMQDFEVPLAQTARLTNEIRRDRQSIRSCNERLSAITEARKERHKKEEETTQKWKQNQLWKDNDLEELINTLSTLMKLSTGEEEMNEEEKKKGQIWQVKTIRFFIDQLRSYDQEVLGERLRELEES